LGIMITYQIHNSIPVSEGEKLRITLCKQYDSKACEIIIRPIYSGINSLLLRDKNRFGDWKVTLQHLKSNYISSYDSISKFVTRGNHLFFLLNVFLLDDLCY